MLPTMAKLQILNNRKVTGIPPMRGTPADNMSRDKWHASAMDPLSDPHQDRTADEVPRETPPFKETDNKENPNSGASTPELDAEATSSAGMVLQNGGLPQATPPRWDEFQLYLAFLNMTKTETQNPGGRLPGPNLVFTADVHQRTVRQTQTASPPRTSEVQAPPPQRHVAPVTKTEELEPRMLDLEQPWQNDHHDPDDHENTELPPLGPPQTVTTYSPLRKCGETPEDLPEQKHGKTPDLTPHAPKISIPQDPAPTPSVKFESEFEAKPRLWREDESANHRQIERTPSRILQPIKVATYKGTKTEEGFQAQRFIKKMETYLRNTPGLTSGQMGLTFFHNLADGAQDWLQSTDDAHMHLTEESLLENWEVLKQKFPHRYGPTDPAESAVRLGQVQQSADE
ncbi:hypothetical protein KFL_008690060, partial [Klebsormidium nitens]